MKKLTIIVLMFVLLGHIAQAQAFKFSPEAADLYQNGMNALRMRKLTVARELFKELIEKHPEDIHTSMARRQMASVMREMQEYDEAISILNEMISNEKSEDNLRYARAELIDILFELQRFRQGIELLEAWRKENPEDIQLSRNLAKFYLQTGRKDEAWLMLESVMEKSASPAAFKDLLNLALVSGEIETLLESLASKRTRFRSNDYADYVSDCYLALNRKDKAIEALQEVDDLERFYNIQTKLADLLISTEKYEEAFNVLTMSSRIMPGEWSVIKKMGHCRFMQGKRDEAMAIWRKPLELPFMQRQTFYVDLASVLIEHQLYEEALEVYAEARTVLQQRTMFSEEVASVLDALGRSDEALEEYLQVMVAGIYRTEIFERLYEAYKKGFALEDRLKALENSTKSPAISQALLEFLFRKADISVIDEILQIVTRNAGRFDEVFYERLNQEALLSPTQFHFSLTQKMISARKNSSLALRLADLILEMGPMDEKWVEEAFSSAKTVAVEKHTADAELKAQLLVHLAEYSLNNLFSIDKAHALTDEILQTPLAKAAESKALDAAILKARMLIYQEKFIEAASLLDETENLISRANENIFAINPISKSEFLAQVLLERARLHAHQSDPQKALESLKNIVETLTESDWTNEALELANFIVRRSIGNFEMLQRALKSERLTYQSDFRGAVKELEKAMTTTASATELLTEMEAEVIELQKHFLPAADVIKTIEAFAAKHQQHFKTADLFELKWKLLKREGAPKAEITEQLQTFVDLFPNDLRSGRFKKILSMQTESSSDNKQEGKQ